MVQKKSELISSSHHDEELLETIDLHNEDQNNLVIDHHSMSNKAVEELNDDNSDQEDKQTSPSKEEEEEAELKEKPKQPQKVTPLPWGKLLVIFFIYLCDSLSYTSLFPYITFMIADFKITDSPTDYGYYVGLIAAAYFLSQFISSFFWGSISDSIGRKPVVLFGTFFGGACSLMFGFSKWLWWACICRFMFGLLNGNLGVVKSYLGEITDSTNQARAFSLTSITFGLSSVIGPLLGGVFSRPYQQYPSFVLLFPEWIQNFIIQFPYVLPSLFISCFCMIGFILGCLKLEEANKHSWYYRKFVAKESEIIEKSEIKGKTTLLSTPTDELEEQDQEPVVIKETLLQKFKVKFNSFRKHEMLSSPIPLTTCLLYLFLGSKQIMFDECLPLFAIMSIDQGGLGLSSYHLGLMGGFLGFVIFFNQLLITPKVVARFSPLTCYRWSLVADTVINVIFPEIVWLVAREDDPVWRHVLFWAVFGLILLLRQVSNGYSFLGTFLITNNSVSRKNYGKLNGTAQSFVALSRMISPILGGSIFASSVAVSKFPIDHRLVFYVVTIVSVVMFFLSLMLKKSINKPKEENKPQEEAKK